MQKVPVELIAEVLAENELEPELISKVLRDLERQVQIIAEEERAQREPPVKKQFVILLSDPQGIIPDEDFVGWVTQIPENDNPGTVIERIKRCAYEFNFSKKGRSHPVESIGEAIEVVGPKFQKEQGIALKTKLPVTVLRTDNVLPKEHPSSLA